MQCPNPSPRPWMLLPLVLSCVVCLGFSCSEREVQDFLADGTEFTFRDQQRVDYVLVLDRSGSMRGDRIEQLTLATSVFVSQLRRGDRAAKRGGVPKVSRGSHRFRCRFTRVAYTGIR